MPAPSGLSSDNGCHGPAGVRFLCYARESDPRIAAPNARELPDLGLQVYVTRIAAPNARELPDLGLQVYVPPASTRSPSPSAKLDEAGLKLVPEIGRASCRERV